ncbi:hypothetical protein [uncultured Desulfovibrio sp.]|uniref:hypothetical protein n=1 Tax=Desulfovibrio legallii TaxID=571438 RepID=UPI00265E06B4|nr:hypothetical protein [uncultured Desulfovibrio sp.]
MKRILVLFVAAILYTTPAFAAGKMNHVSQDIDISNAEITTKSSSMGASGELGFKGFGVDIEKSDGDITIGEISNKGKSIENTSQKINASEAKITSGGADIKVGSIRNE